MMLPMIILSDYYTREQAAKAKRVTTRTIDRWIDAGHVKPTKFHRSILIPKVAFDKFIPPLGRTYTKAVGGTYGGR